MKRKVLGVDIGGVIIDRVNDGTDTSFFADNYLQTTATADVFEVLQKLSSEQFDEVHLVSKCGKRIQGRTLEWLLHHNFYERTGIKRERVHFCRERHQKAGICEELGVTHFVDDRLEVLSYLTMVPTLYLFQSSPDEVQRFNRHLPKVRKVETWKEILARECA